MVSFNLSLQLSPKFSSHVAMALTCSLLGCSGGADDDANGVGGSGVTDAAGGSVGSGGVDTAGNGGGNTLNSGGSDGDGGADNAGGSTGLGGSGGDGLGGVGAGGNGSGGVGTGGDGSGGDGVGAGGDGSGGVGAGGNGNGSGGGDPGGFISAEGKEFRDGSDRFTFVGTNFWVGMNLGASSTGDPARLARELDRLSALGVTNLRVLAGSEGPDTEPYRTVPSLMPEPGVYNQDVFEGLDLLLSLMSDRGMRAVMVLSNFWEWSGGMAQYVSWDNGSKIPYPVPSQDWESFQTYTAKFYSCSSCQNLYKSHIETVITRTNTVNGRIYRDDPTIFSWELANEPRRYPQAWPGEIAQYIKSLDPNHMVTTGSEGSWAENFNTTHSSQYIDYTTTHIWVENWGYYNPDLNNTSSLNQAISFATGYLSDDDDKAVALNKPLVLEEFGIARDGWTAGGKYDPTATITHRDTYYRAMFDAVEDSLSTNGAIQGDNFWAWGGEARPPSAWTGDPPHEEAGWYSIYDSDTSTHAIISAHAATVAGYAGD